MHTVGIIPARLESSRLPNKAIADICGLPMIVHVMKRCQMSKLLNEVFVATDSETISKIVTKHGGNVLMTSSHHNNGTERIAEAAKSIDTDIIVNVQGDEALVMPKHIDSAVSALVEDKSINVSILVNNFSKRNSPSDIKVVLDQYNNVMYLSRSDIPSDSRTKDAPLLKAYHVLAFRKEFLLEYAKWDKGYLEEIEYHEHLRILERGHRIKAVKVDSQGISVDTNDDLKYVRKAMETDPLFLQYSQ